MMNHRNYRPYEGPLNKPDETGLDDNEKLINQIEGCSSIRFNKNVYIPRSFELMFLQEDDHNDNCTDELDAIIVEQSFSKKKREMKKNKHQNKLKATEAGSLAEYFEKKHLEKIANLKKEGLKSSMNLTIDERIARNKRTQSHHYHPNFHYFQKHGNFNIDPREVSKSLNGWTAKLSRNNTINTNAIIFK